MRLYANKKEAQMLQLILAMFIAQAKNNAERVIAQVLLNRIADCLELQDYQQKGKTP